MNIDINVIREKAKTKYPLINIPQTQDMIELKCADLANSVQRRLREAYVKGYCDAIEDLCNK